MEETNSLLCEILKDSFLDPNLIILCVIATISIILGMTSLQGNNIMVIEGTSVIIMSILVSTCNAYLGYVKENQ